MIDVRDIEILLIEDDPNDAELTLGALGKHRLNERVYLINDGAEALECVAVLGSTESAIPVHKLKLVILDLKLPKVGGLEILRMIKSREQTKLIPVVVLTSSAEENDIVKSYQLGANSYVVKPMDFDKFMETVANLGYYWVIHNHFPAFVTTALLQHGAVA